MGDARSSRWKTLIAIGLLGMSIACSRSVARHGVLERTELRYETSLGVVTYPELAEDLGYLAPVKLVFVGSTTSGPQSIQTVVTGDTDFGSAFNGAILKLVVAKAPIRAVIASYGVDDETWSGFYVLENSPIRTARDLVGKKVSMNTLGAHYEFMLREYLARNGLTPEDAKQVTLVVLPPLTAEQTLRNGGIDAAALQGILRDKAVERRGLRLLFSDRQLYGNFNAGSYVFRTSFIEQNPKTVARFVEGVAKAIEWEKATPRDQVIARFVDIIHRRGRNEDDGVVRYWKSTGIASPGGVIRARDIDLWIDWLTRDGEIPAGSLTAGQVYTNEFNPFATAGISASNTSQ